MKIALISCFGYYEQRVRYVKEAFERDGHNVHIFFSDFDHINKQTIKNRIKSIEYLPTKAYKKNLSIARMYSHYHFANDAYHRICKEDFDVIYAIIPPNTLCKKLSKYKRSNNIKLIYDIYDLWPESFVNKRLEKMLFPFFLCWKNLRDKSINVADYVVTECDLYHEVLNTCVDQDKLGTLYLSKPGISIHAKKQLKDEIHICYLGSINNLINIKLICDFLKCVNAHRKVVLEIIGKGESKDMFLDELKKAGITSIYHGALYGLDKERIMAQCHFGINMMLDSIKVGLTMKSIDYFENNLPILNNIKGDTWRLVEKHHIGFNISRETMNDVVKQVCTLTNTEYQCYLQKTEQIFEEKFSTRSFYENFEKILSICRRVK